MNEHRSPACVQTAGMILLHNLHAYTVINSGIKSQGAHNNNLLYVILHTPQHLIRSAYINIISILIK